MCTLIYQKGRGIGFNRDESVLRKKALPPQIHKQGNGMECLFPLDGQAGGTWLAANAAGKVYALMNYYEKEREGDFISRGLLVKEMVSNNQSEPVLLQRFQSFKMMVAGDSSALFYYWDGERLDCCVIDEEYYIEGSSGLLGERANSGRKELFRSCFLHNKDWLSLSDFGSRAESFLSSHMPAKGAMSPCMHRETAMTVSTTIVTFGDGAMGMKYRDGSPCQGNEFVVQSIQRTT